MKQDGFVPFLQERTNHGRSQIESVKNIVTKHGAKSLI